MPPEEIPSAHGAGGQAPPGRGAETDDSTYRLMFERNPLPGWVFDSETLRFLAVNEAAVAHYGYTRGEFLSMTVADIRPPEDLPRLRERIAAADSLLDASGRWRHLKKDGSPIDVEVTSSEVVFAGRPGRLVVVNDVTERRRTEKQLQYQLGLTKTITDKALDALFLMDGKGRVTFMNPAAEEMFGWSRAELVGEVLHDVIHSRRPDGSPFPISDCPLGRVMTAGQAVHRYEDVFYARGGRPVFARCSNAPVFEGGRITGAVLVVSDITERKTAEEELRRSRQLFEGVAEAIPDILYLYDLTEHRVTYASREVSNLLGHTPEEATAMGSRLFETLMHPDDLLRVPEHLARLAALRDGEVEEFEFRMRHAAGGYRWLLSRDVVFTRTPEGRVRLTCGVTQDVTVRRLGRRLVEGQNRVLEMLSTGEPLETILGEIVRVIEEQSGEMLCSVLLADEGGAALRRGAAPSLPPAYFAAAEGLPFGPSSGSCGAAAARRGPVVVEDIASDPRCAGHRDLALSHGLRACWSTPVLSTAGQVIATFGVYYREPRGPREEERRLVEAAAHLIGVAVERRRAEERLRESEGRLRLSQEVAHIGTFDWHVPSGRVVWTEEEERLFGLEPGTFEGSIEGWARRVVPEDAARMQAEMRRAMERGEKAMDFAFRIVRPDGSVRQIEGSGRFSYDAAGNPLHMVGVNLDVTERRRAEEEREQSLAREQQARREAEEANRVKDEFLATLSHELRTPLTAILGWSQMLGGGDLDAATARRAVEVIRRNAESQKQIIEDILDASRIVTGKLRIAPEEVNPLDVVREALDSVRPAAAAKGVELICDFDPQLGLIAGDPHRLRQVVWNLLSNAVKFTGRGGRVQVEAGRTLSSVRLTISDTGAGIAPEFLPYVFDRFRQQDGSTTRQHGGLGLGLSIVRHLVEAHGGSAHAYSAGEGQGASFTVELPLPAGSHRAPPDESAGEPPAGEGAGGAAGRGEAPPPLFGVRVLLVEDEPDALELLNIMLGGEGAEVTPASSADEALQALRRSVPDVIISDIGMPGLDGYELMRRVRSLSPEGGGLVPAVALTAYASEADRLRAIAAGFQTHLAKPVEPEALAAAVAGLVTRARADA